MSKKQNTGNLFIISVLFLVIVAIIIFFFKGRNAEAPENDQTAQVESVATLSGEVVYLEGSVERKSGDSEWVRAEVGNVLQEGDSIEVVGDGRTIVNLDDGSVLRLNGDSSLTLTSMNPDNIVITNNSGELYSRVVKMDRKFEVVVGSVIYESIGTAYKTINNNGEKGVEVYHSKVKVKQNDTEVVVEEGKRYFVEFKSDPVLEKALEPIPDEELNSDFIVWNKEEDKKTFNDELGIFNENNKTDQDNKDTSEAETTVSASNIQLSYQKNGQITWTISGEFEKGFKVVWSKNSNPTYPTRSGDKYKYYSDSNTRNAKIYAFDGAGTYYIRVCEYLGGGCGVYSNQVQATFLDTKDEVKKEVKNEVKDDSITGQVVSIIASISGTNVNWTVDGYSEKGFKVVVSKNPNPTYPTRDGDKYKYVSSPTTNSLGLGAFDGPGVYHVRVCEYLGGKCGVYSNEVTIEF